MTANCIPEEFEINYKHDINGTKSIKLLNNALLVYNPNPELIDINGKDRKTPLHFAVLYNCYKIVEFLVKSGEEEACLFVLKTCLIHQHGSSRNQHDTVIILQLKIRKKNLSQRSLSGFLYAFIKLYSKMH